MQPKLLGVVMAATTAALLVAVIRPAGADEIDLGFNDSAVQAGYVHAIEEKALRLGAGWLHHQDSGDVFTASLLATGTAASLSGPLMAGIGGQVVGISGDGNNRDGFGLAVGGMVKYVFPRYDRFSVAADAWYMPDILTGGDADQYEYLAARASYGVTKQADVYVGARYVKAEFDSAGSLLFDTGMNIGINLRF